MRRQKRFRPPLELRSFPDQGTPKGEEIAKIEVVVKDIEFEIITSPLRVPSPLEFTSEAKGKSVARWGEVNTLNSK